LIFLIKSMIKIKCFIVTKLVYINLSGGGLLLVCLQSDAMKNTQIGRKETRPQS